MQAEDAPRWVPPRGPLGELTRAAALRAQAIAGRSADWAARCRDLPAPPSLRAALRGPSVAVIAEVKRASPSKGPIAPGLEAAPQARRYVRGGASAISVLTEPARFGGSLEDLRAAAAAVPVPVIRKDFLVHPVQLYEARLAGAAAALLIVRALPPDVLPHLVEAGSACGLALLVEIRTPEELRRALGAGADIIGINNRDLETLDVDPDRAVTLLPAIPAPCVRVAESGITVAEQVRAAASAGADAVLVGSAVSAAADPEAAVRALAGIPTGRGGGR